MLIFAAAFLILTVMEILSNKTPKSVVSWAIETIQQILGGWLAWCWAVGVGMDY
jgi:hypothetical protein